MPAMMITKNQEWSLLVFACATGPKFFTYEEGKVHCFAAIQMFYEFVRRPEFQNKYTKNNRYEEPNESHIVNKTLWPVSDVICYSDAYQIFFALYMDQATGQLPENFARLYPQIVAKYFPRFDEIPDDIKIKLGF
jgi:hypothetical protein